MAKTLLSLNPSRLLFCRGHPKTAVFELVSIYRNKHCKRQNKKRFQFPNRDRDKRQKEDDGIYPTIANKRIRILLILGAAPSAEGHVSASFSGSLKKKCFCIEQLQKRTKKLSVTHAPKPAHVRY